MFARFGGIGVGHICQMPGGQRPSLVIDMEVDQTTPSYDNHERSVGEEASGSGEKMMMMMVMAMKMMMMMVMAMKMMMMMVMVTKMMMIQLMMELETRQKMMMMMVMVMKMTMIQLMMELETRIWRVASTNYQ